MPTGLPEILVVAAVIFLLFGAKRLPEMARSLGKAKAEFRRGVDEGEAGAASDNGAAATKTN